MLDIQRSAATELCRCFANCHQKVY